MRRTNTLLRRTAFAFLGVAALLPAVRAVRQSFPSLRPFAHVESPQITEMSGIVRSARYPDVYWVHNDSGDTARIFAIRRDGQVVAPEGTSAADYAGISVVGAKNVDWEDITREGDDLIVSDMGNNKNKRRNLGVYVFAEPDPASPSPVPARLHIPIAYPDQKEFPPKGAYPFDCEALFSLRGKLYFVTKRRMNAFFPASAASLYRLDTRDPNRLNMLKKVDQRAFDGWVTSAAVSPDGKTLAVLTQAPGQSVWLFPTNAKGDRFFSGTTRRIAFSGAKQCEGLCWDDANTLIVTNEQGDLYRLETSLAQPVK